MAKTSLSPLLALVIALVGCESPNVGSAGKAVPPLRPAETSSPPTSTTPEPVAAETSSAPAPAKPDHIAWGNAIAWQDWDTATRAAKAEDKPLCVVVYADWCPRCKELAPEFAKPELARAAENLIMVHQDQDQAGPWLKEKLGQYGNYVPRIFFIDAHGAVREDLQSGHPRYPYFYAPMVVDRLLANMHAASAR